MVIILILLILMLFILLFLELILLIVKIAISHTLPGPQARLAISAEIHFGTRLGDTLGLGFRASGFLSRISGSGGGGNFFLFQLWLC